MAEKKLTKSQRRRRNERIRKEHAKRLGTAPDYVKKSNMQMKEIEKTPAEKAPPHMVSHDISEPDNVPEINEDAQRQLTEDAAEVLADNKKEQVEKLRRRYPQDWKRRGGAKRIASFEVDAGRPIDVRTVQRYIKAGKKPEQQEPQN
jgi:hypothetical protein